MLITTLCYIEHKDHYLMLHRIKKAHDINEGKWIGVGGKFLDRESPEECLLREVREETGYELRNWRFRGFITFLQENYETEYMCLYTADDFLVPEVPADSADPAKAGSTPSEGTAFQRPVTDNAALASETPDSRSARDIPAFASESPEDWPVPDCSEGVLQWIPKSRVGELNLWPGDRIFLRLLKEREEFFSLKLLYSGDDLLEAVLDGTPLPI